MSTTSNKLILHVVGARPNYIKASPVVRELHKRGARQEIVDTSQHHSSNMSAQIRRGVAMPEPTWTLDPVEGGVGVRLAFIIQKLYQLIEKIAPSLVVVYGDIDSTLAASIATKKYGTVLAHVEAGLRSFDDEMPEEINRRVVDELADLCFATEASALTNLSHKGDQVFMVGNTMIDSLVKVRSEGLLGERIPEEYVVLTTHRPSNVDSKKSLENIIEMCTQISRPIIWPIHPRTENNLKTYRLYDRVKKIKNLSLVGPLGYIEFLNVVNKSYALVTDSGGAQEETTFLGVPCLTIRHNTERPITLTQGTNMLVEIREVPAKLKSIKKKTKTEIPFLWDGSAASRIADILESKGFARLNTNGGI